MIYDGFTEETTNRHKFAGTRNNIMKEDLVTI